MPLLPSELLEKGHHIEAYTRIKGGALVGSDYRPENENTPRIEIDTHGICLPVSLATAIRTSLNSCSTVRLGIFRKCSRCLV